MNVGIHELPSQAYHADPAPKVSLSSSIANILLNQSPLHAWLAHPKLNPHYATETDSRFDLGSAAHMMLLERREDRIVRVAADDWRTNKAKEARDAAQAEGKYAVLERHYFAMVAMCKAAREFMLTTELGNILDTGDAERTLVWQRGNLWCRARPDIMSNDRRIILDYKSTENAAPSVVERQISRMGYDLQSEFYTEGLESITQYQDPLFAFLFQEITQPYACSLVGLSSAYRAVGQAKVRRAATIWETCLRTNSWPTYGNQIYYMEPKSWDLAQAEALS